MQPLVVAVQQPEVVLVPLVAVVEQPVAHVEVAVQAELTNPLETPKGKVLPISRGSLFSFRNY